MTPNLLSQQAKDLMSPIDGQVHRQPRLRAMSRLPLRKYLQSLLFKCRR